MSTIAEELHNFIAEEAGMSKDDFDSNTALFSDGYIDSFTMTSVIAFIEDTYNLQIQQSAIVLENFDSIANMVAMIERERAQTMS